MLGVGVVTQGGCMPVCKPHDNGESFYHLTAGVGAAAVQPEPHTQPPPTSSWFPPPEQEHTIADVVLIVWPEPSKQDVTLVDNYLVSHTLQ